MGGVAVDENQLNGLYEGDYQVEVINTVTQCTTTTPVFFSVQDLHSDPVIIPTFAEVQNLHGSWL